MKKLIILMALVWLAGGVLGGHSRTVQPQPVAADCSGTGC